MVPHLKTALSGPLLDLERGLLDNATRIEQWFRSEWLEHVPPFYGSVDLRNSGFKLAPVDMNLFPGGFNNLSTDVMPLCVQAAHAAVERICPNAKRLLLVPENHTRNQYYLQNVARLAEILRLAGLEVRIGSLLADITAPTPLSLPDGSELLLEPLVRSGNRLGLKDFDPCTVLLNNDLSAGAPAILQGLDEQWLLPPIHAGWATRRKSTHFAAYDQVANDFGRLLSIDPWLVNPYFGRCGEIDFHERTGEERLAAEVDSLLTKIRVKYAEYGIEETPFVVVKADAGTYGMGVMTVRDASEVIGLNRRQRNKMSVVKEGLQVSEVIIQEGVHTLETVDGGVAEPVVYMMDHYVIGGFYRVHKDRGRDENLNAPGMHFEPLAFEACCNVPDCKKAVDAAPNRFYAYGVIARLALLAASLEIEQTAPAEEVEA
jgi:glutamate--cysteine ligase